MSLDLFHPAVASWFRGRFAGPTEPQALAWPAIKSGRHTLIAAPTGSGKTLAAFLSALDDLVCRAQEGPLENTCRVLYVSPLKALSNDIQRNLLEPLAGISAELARGGHAPAPIRVLVRTGDTSQKERTAMAARPPHIVVTTPESFYILLTSESGRRMLRTVRTVMVDEIHAVVDDRRGSHLSLSLERLEALTGEDLVRIGLSATQKPIEEVARFLVGSRRVGADGVPACAIVDTGHARHLDLAIELPGSPLSAVMSNEVWREVYDRLAELVREHRTTLVFVNTRRLAERLARHLAERIGAEHVTSHHGSLSRDRRLMAEQRLKAGELRCLVATASLELGIDIGSVELVCQIGSPRSIAAVLQRVGRSGHSLGGRPKGRLFPVSRDDLIECAAVLDSVRRGELDRLVVPLSPLDVLAQQIVAATACGEWTVDALYAIVRGAWPYRDLPRAEFDAVIRMLTTGFTTRRGRSGAWVHHDAVGGKLRARKGARLAAVTSGGAIPDTADYQVVLEPAGTPVGTVNEDFAVESIAGDVFQLGNSSWKILRVEPGKVRVEDAHGQPPTIPFWLGEAPGRTAELSFSVSRLREEVSRRCGEDSTDPSNPVPARNTASATGDAALTRAIRWLTGEVAISGSAAEQIVEYLAAAKAALGAVPTQTTIIFERFFDETGGMQLVIHSPYGSRVNRAWGLALRKRFCRKFNFELQAAATEDAIVLSLGPTHSFPLDEVPRYLSSRTVRDLLVQALLDAPMFSVRWRWNAGRSLAVPRFRGGKKLPAPITRFLAQDLLAQVFPDQLACAENLVGDREIPDHPLVRQTILDCLEEAMDAPAFEDLLRRIEGGEVRVLARDLTEPSPLALEILNARPYAFLDDAPLEERRTQAVASRRWLDAETASDLGALDAAAIARVREEARLQAETEDELHDALVVSGFIPEDEAALEWLPLFGALTSAGRATVLTGIRALAAILPRDPEPASTSVDQDRSHDLHDAVSHMDAVRSLTSAGASDAAANRITSRGLEGPRVRLWVAAERLPQVLAIFPGAHLEPPIVAPPGGADEEWSFSSSLVELVRARIEISGPTTPGQLAAESGLPTMRIEEALASLETEGFAMRGRFTPGVAETEWCSRRLLARIHRYTLDRLRREIEPVSASDFIRFLAEWQGVPTLSQSEYDARTRVSLQSGTAPGTDPNAPAPSSGRGPTGPDREGSPRGLSDPRGSVVPVRPHTIDAGSALDSADGPSALAAILDQLEGFEAPAASWEEEILPARLARYDPAWLDALCLSGRLSWMRLRPPRPGPKEGRGAAPVRTTPICLLQRANLDAWTALTQDAEGRAFDLSSAAQTTHDWLAARGASFFEEIVRGTGLLRPQAEGALAELVARGVASSDGFAGLRALLTPSSRRSSAAARRRKRSAAPFGMESAGRWALLPSVAAKKAAFARADPSDRKIVAGAYLTRGIPLPVGAAPPNDALTPDASRGARRASPFEAPASLGSSVGDNQSSQPCRPLPPGRTFFAADTAPPRGMRRVRGWSRETQVEPDAVEARARALLRRYGVIFRRILDRETIPTPWRDLLRAYRRLEARGEIRGGRFVAGFTGEQFALPEAVGTLRSVRRRPASGELLSVSAADPLNLAGILTPGARVSSAPANRILYRDGVPIAVLEAGEVRLLVEMTEPEAWSARAALTRRSAPSRLNLRRASRR